MEGEGGITAGASHETINSAWGLGLGNLVYHLGGMITGLIVEQLVQYYMVDLKIGWRSRLASFRCRRWRELG